VDDRSLETVINQEAKKARRRRVWVGAVAVLVLAAAGAVAVVLRPKPQPLDERYRQAVVERGTLIRTTSANGRVEARSTVNVGAEISGRIAEVLVEHDQRVDRGQVLATFDTESLDAQLEQAEANVRVARANLKKAKVDRAHAESTRERSESLHARGFEPRANVDEARTGAKRAEVALEAASAQLGLQRATRALALATLKDAEIRSPIAGVVIRVDVDAGQTVAASLQSPTLFVIAEDLTKMRVTASIDEADIGEIAVGQRASFTVDAYAGREFPARVTEVRSAAQVVQNVVTYEAMLEVENADLALKPGMTASVRIETGRVEHELIVPTAALRFTPPDQTPDPKEAEHAHVWVAVDEELRSLHVEPVLADDTRSAVIGDRLEKGQSVLVGLTAEGKQALEQQAKRGG
jgi:HlyD family secretion protein